jgi:hypothetical protein
LFQGPTQVGWLFMERIGSRAKWLPRIRFWFQGGWFFWQRQDIGYWFWARPWILVSLSWGWDRTGFSRIKIEVDWYWIFAVLTGILERTSWF